MLTSAVDTINIWVEANHEFIASPKHVVIPLGEKIQVDLNGTGSYSAAISGSGVQVTNELILGDAVGSGLIQYTDNFTALTVTVGFQVRPPGSTCHDWVTRA